LSSDSVKYIATLAHVKEVLLLGSADLAYWTDRLRPAALRPAAEDGRAQLMIVAVDSRYKGIRFREMSFSVVVSWHDSDRTTPAAYLVEAFNSRWLLAFCERVLFSTPYRYGEICVSTASPARIELLQDGECRFRATTAADADESPGRAVETAEADWSGPIFLPEKRRTHAGGRAFFARLSGRTCSYPFDAARDELCIRPSVAPDIFQALSDSGFTGTAWQIRADATHARSKTFPRSAIAN
jgi:hypothetical protein